MQSGLFLASVSLAACISIQAQAQPAPAPGAPAPAAPRRSDARRRQCGAGISREELHDVAVLLGSRSSTRFELGEGADVDVDATRDDARVVLAAAGYDKTFSADQLESGFSEQIDVTSPAGESFVVTLSSSCPAVTTP